MKASRENITKGEHNRISEIFDRINVEAIAKKNNFRPPDPRGKIADLEY